MLTIQNKKSLLLLALFKLEQLFVLSGSMAKRQHYLNLAGALVNHMTPPGKTLEDALTASNNGVDLIWDAKGGETQTAWLKKNRTILLWVDVVKYKEHPQSDTERYITALKQCFRASTDADLTLTQWLSSVKSNHEDLWSESGLPSI